MKYTTLLILTLALGTNACLQPVAATENTEPAPTQKTPNLEEVSSGAVYEIPPATQTPLILCVTAQVAVHLRTEPNHKAVVLDWLKAGTEVQHIGYADGWNLVWAGERTGYIKSEYLGRCK